MHYDLLLLLSLSVALVTSLGVTNYEQTLEPKSPFSLTTSLGTVLGYKKNVHNRTINVFYGLPYGEPPVGRLRFRKSKLVKKFPEEPYDARQFKPHCAQRFSERYTPDEKFSEDCLYLNVYTPSLETMARDADGVCEEKYSVMIYLYGGTASIYQMSYLLDKNNQTHLLYSGDQFASLYNTILVTINFRMQLFATLYLENIFHGNLGLFDQNLALQWVKKHIKEFCGDEENLTLFGNSAGGSSVGYHINSKYSKGLIRNAIMQSPKAFFSEDVPITRNELLINSFLAINELGCMNLSSVRIDDHYAQLTEKIRQKYFDNDDRLKEKFFLDQLRATWKARSMARLTSPKSSAFNETSLDKDDYIEEDILKLVRFLSVHAADVYCLEHLPTETVARVDQAYTTTSWSIYYDFDFIDREAYLDYKRHNKLSLNPELNLLIGTIEEENCRVYLDYKDKYYTDRFHAPVMSKEDVLQYLQSYLPIETDLDKDDLTKAMADFYADERNWKLPRGYFEAISNLASDLMVNCATFFYTYYAAWSAKPVSAYHITQKTNRHLIMDLRKFNLENHYWLGPCHADELFYLFGLPHRVPNAFSDLDRSFSNKLLHLWTTFARDGKMPNLWPSNETFPFSSKHSPNPRFVEVNAHFTRERQFEFEERCTRFWGPLLSLYKR